MFSYERGKNRIIVAAAVLSLMGSVAGCGASSDEKQIDIAEVVSFGQGAGEVADYEVPVQIPNILVDQNGFRPGDEKVFSHWKRFLGARIMKTVQYDWINVRMPNLNLLNMMM